MADAERVTRAAIRRKAAWRPSTFQALGNRNYRLLWLGQLGSSASMWMEQVARPLLILDLTGSAAMLGLVMATRMVPMLTFGLLAGVVADRFDRQKVLMLCQTSTLLVHLATALLILTGLIEPWHVFALAFAMGTAMSFNQPARQALIPSLVGRENLTNAIALNTVAMNTMRIVGASMGGVLAVVLGLAGLYLLNSGLYVITIIMTVMIQVPPDGQVRRVAQSMASSLGESLRYAAQNQVVLGALAMAIALFTFGLPYQSVFIPLMVKQVFEASDAWVGYLMSATGIGALCGALTVATISRPQRRGLFMAAGAILFGTMLIVFSLSAQLALVPLAFVVIALVGALQTSYMAINNTVILESSPSEMHGRVSSLLSLDRGLIPLGATIGGFLAEFLGPVAGLIVFGSLCIAAALVIVVFVPAVRRIN